MKNTNYDDRTGGGKITIAAGSNQSTEFFCNGMTPVRMEFGDFEDADIEFKITPYFSEIGGTGSLSLNTSDGVFTLSAQANGSYELPGTSFVGIKSFHIETSVEQSEDRIIGIIQAPILYA